MQLGENMFPCEALDGSHLSPKIGNLNNLRWSAVRDRRGRRSMSGRLSGGGERRGWSFC